MEGYLLAFGFRLCLMIFGCCKRAKELGGGFGSHHCQPLNYNTMGGNGEFKEGTRDTGREFGTAALHRKSWVLGNWDTYPLVGWHQQRRAMTSRGTGYGKGAHGCTPSG